MLDTGIRATVNSDDPAYFLGYMNENLSPRAGGGRSRPRPPGRSFRAMRSKPAGCRCARKDAYLAELDAYAAK